MITVLISALCCLVVACNVALLVVVMVPAWVEGRRGSRNVYI